MLKIDVIKFEAQDVVTASIPTPNNKECICELWCFSGAYQEYYCEKVHGYVCPADSHVPHEEKTS